MNQETKEVIKLLTKDVAFWDNFDGKVAELHREDYDAALAKLREAQEPTSLGNTLRSIADKSIKSETDRNIIYQAARRLDRWWAYIQELEAQLKTKDELLFAFESVRAPKQLPDSDFTKRFRELIELSIKHSSKNKIGRLRTYGKEACDRLDRSEASWKELLTACEELVKFCYPDGKWRGWNNMKGILEIMQPIRRFAEKK